MHACSTSLKHIPQKILCSLVLLAAWLSACEQPPPSATQPLPIPTASQNPTSPPVSYPPASSYPTTYPIPYATLYFLPASPYPPPATLPPIPPTNITAVISATIQTLLHPFPTRFASASFADPQHGWVAAEQSIFVTTDSGVNWTWLTDLPAPASQIDFIDLQQAWALTTDGLFRSRNGGLMWQPVMLPASVITDTAQIKDSDFSSAQRGWIVLKDRFLRTNDGGNTWETGLLPCAETLGPSLKYMEDSSIYLLNETEAWLICGGEPAGWMHMAYKWLFYSPNDGNAWELIHAASPENAFGPGAILASGYWPNLFFLDNFHGWVATNSYLISTENSGITWKGISVPGFEATLSNPHFFNSQEGIVTWGIAGERFLLRTHLSGGIWLPIFPPALPRKIQFLDAQNGFGAGFGPFNKTIFRTQDSGKTWQAIGQIDPYSWEATPGECTGYISEFYFTNLQIGWAVISGCGTQKLYSTQDGGSNWSVVSDIPATGDISNLFFLDSQTGYIYDPHWNKLLTTQNGGKTFEMKYIPEAETYSLIAGNQLTKIFQNKLYRSSDGGQTWIGILQDYLIIDYDLLSGGQIWVLSADCPKNRLSGQNPCQPHFLHSQDNGLSWTIFDFGSYFDVLNPYRFWITIDFADPQHGWLRTEDHLYATTDGSSTWNMVR